MDARLAIANWGQPTTLEEFASLNECYPFNAHAQRLCGLGEGQRLPEDEDVNIPENSEPELEQPKEEANDGDDDANDGDDNDDWKVTERAFYDEGDDEE